MWEWQGQDFSLQKDSDLGVPHCLWNDMNQNNSNSLCSWEEHTPIKGCGDLRFDLDLKDETNQRLESRESSQLKRRRMLQFTPDANDKSISNEQISIEPENSKEFEGSLLADEFLQCLEWDPEWNSSFSDGRYAFGGEGFDQSSEGWLADCLTETETHQSSGEMSTCTNDSVEFSEPFKIPSKQETVKVKEKPKPSICRVFRGKKSIMNTPTKLTTTVAYPFTLIKPCENQGDVTLRDINQRVHAPSPSTSEKEKDGDSSCCYPTSAFSGKPVVVKTKIRTEGGKGSITILRTKG